MSDLDSATSQSENDDSMQQGPYLSLRRKIA